jgi:hypothetical protein
MSNFLDELKKYFESTPQNKILEDWAKSERYDEIGPTPSYIMSVQKLLMIGACKL